MISSKQHLFWVDGLKAFAILGIILNHFVESFGSIPWFSNPSYNWPDITTRISSIFPSDGNIGWRIVQFLGWLGDMGPGIFILLSGFTLTLSALGRTNKEINLKEFYTRRLIRIFPLYLIIHLIVILTKALIDSGPDFTSTRLFLSMLGLRFTDQLFFFINPSWWFIWLIIQLYLVFPLLFKILNKKGVLVFLAVTLGFTLLSRFAGLIRLTWADHLEYWMTGLFAGTRLSEFAAGMVLAKIIYENKTDILKLNLAVIFPLSLLIYITGFICSVFYITTLISNTLITIGLAGLLFSFCRFIESDLPALIKPLKWIGAVSFPVFLIHQPFLQWFGQELNGVSRAGAGIFVILLSFVAAWIIENIVNRGVLLLKEIKNKIINVLVITLFSLQLLLNILYFITGNELIYKSDVVIFIINIFFIPLLLIIRKESGHNLITGIAFLLIPSSVIFLFILTKNWFGIFWIFTSVLIIVQIVLSSPNDGLLRRLLIPFIITITLFLISESLLERVNPAEVNKWGELPVLQKDSETVYSLIPGKRIRLRYNNYDYFVNTNSLGFNGPGINLSDKENNNFTILVTGDAFTMPEGLEYQRAYPNLLQTILRKEFPDRKIRVINAGVTGYGPNEMYASLKKYLDTIKPDLVINQIFINEYSEINIEPELRLKSIGLQKQPLRDKLFAGFRLPMLVSFYFHRLLNDKHYQLYIYNKSLAYYYEKDSKYYSEENLKKLRDYFRKVRELCDEKKCECLVLYAPGQLEVSSPDHISYYPEHIQLSDSLKYDLYLPGKTFRLLCEDAQVTFLDPTAVLKSNEKQPVYFSGSWHWNSRGHRVIADFLEQNIRNLINHK